MTESPEDLFDRARGSLRRPPVEDWLTFPFEGDLRVRELLPPVAEEPPRAGEAGDSCWRCDAGDSDAIWSDERWILSPLREPSGMPVVVILSPRAHHDMGDLPEELQQELGPLLVRIERASRRSAGSAGSTSAAGATAASTSTFGSSPGRSGCRS